MHWKVLCLSLLLSALLVAGCNKGNKTAVVNSEKAIEESDAGKAGMAHLEKISKEIQDELIALQNNPENEGASEEVQIKVQQRMRDAQQRFNAEQQHVWNKLSTLYKNTLDAYRNKEKLDVILGVESLLSYSPHMDITDKVIAEMNRTPVSFAPLGEDEEEKPESAGAASANATLPATSTNATAPAANATKP